MLLLGAYIALGDCSGPLLWCGLGSTTDSRACKGLDCLCLAVEVVYLTTRGADCAGAQEMVPSVALHDEACARPQLQMAPPTMLVGPCLSAPSSVIPCSS